MRKSDFSRHAAQRLNERMGLRLTPELEAEILSRIRGRKAIPESQNNQENTVTYKMTIGGQVLRVVYSFRAQKVLTVMQSRLLTVKP